MLKPVFLITIIKRSLGEEAISFLNENKVPLTLGRYGKGTVTDGMCFLVLFQIH